MTGNQSLTKLLCQGSEPTETVGSGVSSSVALLLLLLVATSAISMSLSRDCCSGGGCEGKASGGGATNGCY